MRKPINKMLTLKWWDKRMRPTVLSGKYPYIGLVVDNTSIQVYRPQGTECDRKRMWDRKHKFNALKKEVGVMACKPHYALFSCPSTVGSVH
ncbi:hypothetical protein A3Q56_07885, partial [Intoshia linei]